MDYIASVKQALSTSRDEIIQLSDTIWDISETKFNEFRSQKQYCAYLARQGFSLTVGIGGLPTAFKAVYGNGEHTIGFLGEYDALPGLDQKAMCCHKEPTGRANGNGQGCGHNMLGTGALAAAIAVKKLIEKGEISGRVIFYGCPAEEGGSGKAWMVREHCFDESEVLLTWHPYAHNTVMGEVFLASIQAVFKFNGVAAHAAGCPHLGRSALDAVELMNVGVNFLREHVVPEARMHYAILDAGGKFANVVQAHAEVLYQLRAPKMKDVYDIYERVQRIAKGAALMTDTAVEVHFDRCCSEIRPNHRLNQIVYEIYRQAGTPVADEKDVAFARQIRESFGAGIKGTDERALRKHYGGEGAALAERLRNKAIIDELYPLHALSNDCYGSTDVGDVSQIRPTAQISVASFAKDTPGHTWQVVAQGKAPFAHKALMHTGLVLGAAAARLLKEPALLEEVKAEFARSYEQEPYLWPIPEGAEPPIKQNNGGDCQ